MEVIISQFVGGFSRITMGFVLNNWSENNKKNKLTETYRKSLLEDINTNITELETFIAQDKQWLTDVERLLDEIDKNPVAKVDSLQSILNYAVTINTISVQKYTFESLKNTGDMSLLACVDLRTDLVKYYSGNFVKVEFAEQYLLNFLNSFVIPLVLETYDRFEGVFLNLEKDKIKYTNNLISFYVAKQQLLAIYQNLLAHSKAIQQKLKKNEKPNMFCNKSNFVSKHFATRSGSRLFAHTK